jgi:thioredoxin-related protein
MKPIILFFSKVFGGIWNWIKETAWVQPLLIVSFIFSIIFSIPTISTWIQDITDDLTSPEAYYRNFQVSLRNDEESEAQKLVDAMMDEETYQSNEKFLLVFVDSTCSACKSFQPAVKLLVENTSQYYNPDDFESFKIYTIFRDEEFDNTDSSINAKTPFEKFLDRNDEFLQRMYEVGFLESDYAFNTDVPETGNDYENFIAPTPSIPTPTVVLYDVTADSTRNGIREVIIGVPGADSQAKAELISDMWVGRNDFILD